MSLTEFLLARIAEDKAAARDCGAEVGHLQAGDPYEDGSGVADRPDYPSYPWGIGERELAFAERFDPARVLAECEAKRRIVELHHDRTPADITAEHLEDGEPWTAECAECSCYGDCRVELPCPTLRALALPYADHPDYLPEWHHDPENAESAPAG